PSNGAAQLAPGASVGYLPQEPQLDESLDVRGNVELGVAEQRALLDRFNEVSARFAEPMSDDEMAALLEEQGEIQERIERVAGWILELDRGKGIPFQGNYSSWLEQKEARLGVEEKQASARRRTLQRELEWVRMSPRARHAKSKARLSAYEQLLAEEQSVRLESVEIHIPAGERLGDKVVEARGLGKGFGDRLLFEDMTFSLPPGGIVGVIGPNGAGKTTLFRMIVGQEQPDAGSLEIG